ncbi:hypothetical protein WR25_23895 [Diploscapter pachys]|uniref:Uncharacterized protein n=1 Tax=Diploscapter pachys TaxID=2018661 RepID=A0A2A2M4D7_9BILA|nr:hypothetical protein WR25_23895 [Diploscapter pachys]
MGSERADVERVEQPFALARFARARLGQRVDLHLAIGREVTDEERPVAVRHEDIADAEGDHRQSQIAEVQLHPVHRRRLEPELQLAQRRRADRFAEEGGVEGHGDQAQHAEEQHVEADDGQDHRRDHARRRRRTGLHPGKRPCKQEAQDAGRHDDEDRRDRASLRKGSEPKLIAFHRWFHSLAIAQGVIR